ncbi:MAG: MMPL family transporter [Myxococcota bacterium]
MHSSEQSRGSWGRHVYRARRGILLASAVVLALAGVVLARGARLSIGDFENEESKRAGELIAGLERPGDSSFLLVLSSKQWTVVDDAFQSELADTVSALKASPEVVSVISPVGLPGPAAQRFYAQDARHALVAVTMRGDLPTAAKHYPEVRALVPSGRLDASFTGKLPLMNDIEVGLRHDLLRAEAIAIPISLLLLLFVFRSLVAALLPVVVGGLAVAAGVAAVFALSHVADVPNYAINICSLIGLGVAIDYSLFIVSRYRDELALGRSVEDALAITLHTAGRSVVFSGLTVATGLTGLLFFHGSFLAALGVAGALVVGFAVIAALTTLPALLGVLGAAVDRGRFWPRRPGRSSGRWHAFALTVTRRPWLFLVPAMAFVGFAAWPYSRLEVATTDVSVLPPDAEARVGFGVLREAFPEIAATRINVVVEFPSSPALTSERVHALYATSRRLAALPHVRSVESIVDLSPGLDATTYAMMLTLPEAMQPRDLGYASRTFVAERATLMTVVSDARPSSPEARELVRSLRADRAVADGGILVGGQTARDLDSLALVAERSPSAVAFIIGITIAILFVLLRSVLLPIKAVLMNLLSIGASFGALVWVFQEGHGRDILMFEPGFIDPTLPVMLFCLVFGLSMDYEVLLLHRMQEEYERTGDNSQAVAEGLSRTSGLITSAAAIMVSVFAAFSLARILVVKATGVGIVVAIIMDATIVRLLIVPSTMALLGDLNWWAPKFLARRRAPNGGAASDSKRLAS